KFDQTRFAGPVRIFHRGKYAPRLIEHFAFNAGQQRACRVVRLPRRVEFAAHLGFERAATGLDLLSLPPRARDLALIAIKEWKWRAEKKAQRVAGSGYSLLPAVFRAENHIDFPLSHLQTPF